MSQWKIQKGNKKPVVLGLWIRCHGLPFEAALEQKVLIQPGGQSATNPTLLETLWQEGREGKGS
jgi:hypothetical protein